MRNDLPKEGEKFNAYDEYGNLTRCSPYVCLEVHTGYINAKDEEGDLFELQRADFTFEVIED